LIGMKNMRKTSLIFLLSVFLPAAALAQGPPEGKGPEFPGRGRMMGPMHHHMEDWSRQLNLTEEQTVKLQALRESYLRETLVWRDQLVIKRFDLRDLLRDPQSDPNQALAKQREISDLESKIQERAVLHQLEMRKVLTPEQIKLLPPWFGTGGFRGHRMMPGGGPGKGRE
jgi:Spy/CpxP family protein refolding chaperone